MSREASWADMATAVMAHLDAYGAEAIYDVWHVLNGYTVTATTPPCGDCDAPGSLAEPTPGLTAPQRAALVLLTARPRTREEVADLAGWNPGTAAGVLRSLERRGLAAHAAGLWSRR
ncbi:MarR family transcriptional regulator [Microbacterium sp. PI-1]|uniref:MarR family winged helix-turn-helix transcriptional regulator n=1 Tax=Microbacterium sp. PI-1 TaxID=2545631 RepID=UPI0010398635|nr:MarR family winged helix-turn-helix transcriptional regulator [Microbacterium sp. PI-1]TCJ29814.1 MarR family transcriptional regulator [Microbacterium sp. PI-1]